MKTEFDKFWEMYPRKVAKSQCKKIWARKKLDKNIDEILEALTWQRNYDQWQNKQLIPHPSTWLNQGRWEDEYDPNYLVQSTSKGQMDDLKGMAKEISKKTGSLI